MKKLMMAVVVAMMSFASFGYGSCWTDPETGIAWKYLERPDGVVIGDYNSAAIPTTTSGKVAVPLFTAGGSVVGLANCAFLLCSSMTDVEVSSMVGFIGNYAFYGCSSLTNIVIGANLVEIGKGVFAQCGRLTRIHVNPGNSYYASVDGVLFTKDETVIVACGGGMSGDYIVPRQVKKIGDAAFQGCSGLTRIVIPSSVANIGADAFYDCQGLSIDFEGAPPDGIGNASVKTDAAIRYNVVYEDEWSPVIEVCGFTNASSYVPCLPDGGPYTEVVDGVEWTFMVTNLESVAAGVPTETAGKVAIPSTLGGRTVTGIGESAFWFRSGLTSVTIPTSVVSIGGHAFYECSGLTSVTIPSGVTSIEDDVFCGCSGLTSVTIPDGVVSIGASAFAGCSGLTSVTIPSGVTSIGGTAFSNCSGLTSVTIPASVTSIGHRAFNGCTSLSDVYFKGNTIGSCPSEAFNNCHWDLIMHVPATWKGRGKTLCGYTVVRDGEEEGVIAANLTVTNVIVQYVLNSVQPEIAVPVSGDTGFTTIITEVKSAGAVSVPSEWKDNYPAFESKFGTDFAKALMSRTGKRDGANNEMLVWQDFVAGTDPTNPDDKFTAFITMVEGVPVISYTPELSDAQKALREYKTFGKKQLKDEWTNLTDADGETMKDYNFFKVTVEMK